ncbi:G-protein coupled receptor 182-like [Astyanax mexicanus]|nr:G-protein coupled receptor 182-like [Astyanax mexicanus]KAG9260403.1 G-protein coupled receptor 182-like [Astyanax mexicanus]
MDYFDNDTEFFHCTVKVDYNSRRIGLFLLHLLVFMVGLVMNVTVVWVNWQRRHSRNTVLFCQLNMGLADTMIMIMLPIYMLEVVLDHVWLWGDFLCRFSNLVVVLSIYASCFFLAYMSVERYLAVVRGSAPKAQILGMTEKRKRNIICAALWLVALFLAALETAHVRILHLQDPGCYLMPTHAYTEWFTSIIIIQTFIQFIVPAAVVATANILAARAVRACPEVQARSAGDVWLLHVYSAVFVVCWLPYHLIMMLMMIDILKPSLFDCNMLEQLFFAYTVVRTTALLHCLANPLLYCFLSRSFRSKLISLVLRHLPQDVAPVPGPDQPGHAAQAEATANGKKAGNAGENSTSQSEGS